jgi:hypothetical protein
MLARMLFQIFATGELIRNYCYNVFVLQRFALSDNGIGVESNCQQKDLMASFLFNPVYHEGFADVLENLYPVIDLLLKYNYTYYDINARHAYYRYLVKDAYAASLYTLRGTVENMGINFDPSFYNAFNFSGVFDFCGFDCSMFTVRFQDYISVIVSEYAYNLYFGSCGPLLDFDNWAHAVAQTPTPLEETYYTCTEMPLTALSNALGISSGIISLILTVITLLLVPWIVFTLKKKQVQLPNNLI